VTSEAPPDRAHPQRPTAAASPKGLRTAIFQTRLYDRSLQTGLAITSPAGINSDLPIANAFAPPTPLSTNGTNMKKYQPKNLPQMVQKMVDHGT
jgi:hypothetical protein